MSITYLNGYWISSKDERCGVDFVQVIINDRVVADAYNTCQATATHGYEINQVDLQVYAGQTVNIQFRLTTDQTDASLLLIDDVSFAASRTVGPIINGKASQRPGQANRGP
jgi:hypothetical protein